MTSKRLTRRDFLASSGLASVMVLIAGARFPGTGVRVLGVAAASEPGSHMRQTLLRFVRHLYPHDDVSDAAYGQVVERLLADAGKDPEFDATLSGGLAALDSARQATWLSLAPNDQIEVMREQETRAYFPAIQAPVRNRLYDHPAVWKVMGYEGPSAHLGGYINRGFDDIDWLPEDD